MSALALKEIAIQSLAKSLARDPSIVPAASEEERRLICTAVAPLLRDFWRETAKLTDHQIIKNCQDEVAVLEVADELEKLLHIRADVSLAELMTFKPSTLGF